MRSSRSPLWGKSLLATLALCAAAPASAITVTVGDGSGDTVSTMREAISLVNEAGLDGAPHAIVVDSTLYSASLGELGEGLSCDSQTPLPVLYYPVEIASTLGAEATAALPPISSRSTLTLTDVSIGSGAVNVPSFPQGEFVRCDRGIVVRGGDLIINDVSVFSSQSQEGEPYMADIAVDVEDSSADVDGLTITDFEVGVFTAQFFNQSDLPIDYANIDITGLETSDAGMQFVGTTASVANATIRNIGPFDYAAGIAVSESTVVLTDSDISENGIGLTMFSGRLDIANTNISFNSEGGIRVESESPEMSAVLDIEGCTFADNTGEYGGAILFASFSPTSFLSVRDTSFTDNLGLYGGAIAMAGRAEFRNITASGTQEDAWAGGFMMGFGQIDIIDSEFTNLGADSDGGVFAIGGFDQYFQAPVATELRVHNSSFVGSTADRGAVVFAGAGALASFSDSTFDDSFAYTSGGVAHLTTDTFNPDSQGRLEGGETRRSALSATDHVLLGSAGLSIADSAITEAISTWGGSIAAVGEGHAIDLTSVTVEDSYAESPNVRGIAFPTSGSGGLIAAEGGTTVRIAGLQASAVEADNMGGLIYSGPFEGGFLEQLGLDPFDNCRAPSISPSGESVFRFKSLYDLEGIEASGLFAGFQGGIGLFSDGDDVGLHGSAFTDVVTGFQLARGLGAPTTAHIATENVASFEMSCTEICSADDSVGNVVAHYEAPSFSVYPSRVPQIDLHNNVFNANQPMGSVVGLDVCLAGGDIILPFGIPLDTQDTDYRDTDWIDTNDTGDTISGVRGFFKANFNTFSGATAGVAIGGKPEDVAVSITNNLFDGGEVALSFVDSMYLDGGYNQFNGFTAIAQDDAAQVFPGPTDFEAAPTYWSDAAECGALELYLADGSAGQDAADPDQSDWWNDSRADVGAFGGPNACFPDADLDGYIVVADCDDSDMDIRPGANETPYDGIDQDCDGADLCDVDGDGFISDAEVCGGDDCDDARADINPDAAEIWYDGIDQNCSSNDCDQDGDGYAAANEECGGSDCDDTDASINPGATELAGDAIDSNCDGNNEPEQPTVVCDDDEDGAIAEECGGIDCDDSNAGIRPGADEVPYDGIDQDCDGADLCDVDGDGFDAMDAACGGDDCDDNDASVYPGAPEVLDDTIDQDCDGFDEQLFVEGGPGCDCSSTGGLPVGMGWLAGAAVLFGLRRRRQ